MINSDGELMEEGDCPTTDEDSEMDSDSEVVCSKSAQGTQSFARNYVLIPAFLFLSGEAVHGRSGDCNVLHCAVHVRQGSRIKTGG